VRLLRGLAGADAVWVLRVEARTTVYQEPRLVPSKRVLANVTIGQPRRPEVKAAGQRALDEVRLSAKATAWPATLSGGEAQRVALARALVRQPELLLLDEPFAALDALTRLQMQDLVGDLVLRHRPAVLLVTHDVDEAIALADRVLVLRDGGFGLDVRIDDPHPRDRTSATFLAYRRVFLEELGVGTLTTATATAETSTDRTLPQEQP
jgi:sulfonate transport system ATP-binding protein